MSINIWTSLFFTVTLLLSSSCGSPKTITKEQVATYAEPGEFSEYSDCEVGDFRRGVCLGDSEDKRECFPAYIFFCEDTMNVCDLEKMECIEVSALGLI